MSDDVLNSPKLLITKVSGGSERDQANLKDCYFESINDRGDYLFYGKADSHIPTIPDVLTRKTDNFKFIRDGLLWTVTKFHLDPLTEVADGHWSNPRQIENDDGEFHAQAGPQPEEAVSSASA